jgi:hypothetical protein
VVRKFSFILTLVIGIPLMIFIPARWGFSSIHESNCTLLNALNSVRNINVEEQINVMTAAIGVQIYLKKNFKHVNAGRMKESFSEFSEKYKINAIFVTPELQSLENIKNNTEFVKVLSDTSFVKLTDSDCTSYFLIKKNILK